MRIWKKQNVLDAMETEKIRLELEKANKRKVSSIKAQNTKVNNLTEKMKQFAWDICGSVIVENLLNRNNNKIHYPQLVTNNGEFTYCGKQFIMCEKEVEVKSDGYFE